MINIWNVVYTTSRYCSQITDWIADVCDFEFLHFLLALLVVGSVALCLNMGSTYINKHRYQLDIPNPDTNTTTRLYPIYYYDHIDIQLVGEQGSADSSLSVLLTEGNPNKLTKLPPTEFSRIEEIELCLFELEKSLTYELQEFSRNPQHSRILISLFFLRLRSICRGKSALAVPGYREVLKECCYRILTAEAFLLFVVDSKGDPCVLTFINDVAYFLGATVDSAYPDLLSKLCQLLENEGKSRYNKTENIQYTYTVLLLQTLTESSITKELKIMLDIIEKEDFGERSRKMVINCLTVLLLSREKQLKPLHLAYIDRLLLAGMNSAWLSVRENSATAFGNYKIFFPDFAYRLKNQFTDHVLHEIDTFMPVST